MCGMDTFPFKLLYSRDTEFLKIKSTNLFPLGLEPRTSRVLGERDQHYSVAKQFMEDITILYVSIPHRPRIPRIDQF